MSHELRTPLNSMLGLIKIVLDEGDLTEEQFSMLNIISKSSHSLLRTVNDILDISKLEAGQVVIESKSFNLPGLLHSLVEQLKPLASQKGLQLISNHNILDPFFVFSDEHRITRIVNNIMSNSIKYTEKGKVEFTFDIEDREDGSNVFVFTAMDTGIGISNKNLDKIFDKFAQAENSTERLYGGTGLGLAITKQLVDLMSGKITVESELKKGTTFRVEIPITPSDKQEKPEAQSLDYKPIERSKKHKKIDLSDAKILIVEDHEFNQVFVEKILTRLNNNSFKVVSNGVEACSEFKNGGYDLILMDCHMPKMNGYEAVKSIRNFEKSIKVDSNIPIIAMTADVMPGTKEQCLDAGMDDYISKPIDEDLLKEKIEIWFNVSKQKNRRTVKKGNKEENKINLSLLEEYSNNDTKIQKDLVAIFSEKSLADVKKLKKICLEEEKHQEWEEVLHSLKGSAAYIGAHVLVKLCEFSRDIDSQSIDSKKDAYTKIKKEHKSILKILKDKNLL